MRKAIFICPDEKAVLSIPIAVGTGTWGIAAVIPKYLSLRLPKVSDTL